MTKKSKRKESTQFLPRGEVMIGTTDPGDDLEETVEEQPEVVAEEKPKTYHRYIQCPFCQNKQDRINSRDITGAWCENCGRCFCAEWKEEYI